MIALHLLNSFHYLTQLDLLECVHEQVLAALYLHRNQLERLRDDADLRLKLLQLELFTKVVDASTRNKTQYN